MAEGGQDYLSDNEYESDDFLFDSSSEDLSDNGRELFINLLSRNCFML